ncbi:MAG: prepilin-type N-terminal cleavage/methylation domain-containing protein, partial [Candidatus Eremiobacteraeota bacterium]|nr:prepilin-type N-terminal cleavage/methylation domain-containing protein [Candidatus Eremiobacteraeota bacterium]
MRGFTLVEVLVALGLVILIYALVGFTTLQVARYTRRSQEAANRKTRLISASNQLRWQLRCLAAPTGAQALAGQRTDTEGRDRLRFLTSRPAKDRGVVEVAYEIQEVDDKPTLMYRE